MPVMRYVIMLVVGLVTGYSFGFKDAKTHDENIAVRIVGKIGGSSREKVRSNADKTLEEAEKP